MILTAPLRASSLMPTGFNYVRPSHSRRLLFVGVLHYFLCGRMHPTLAFAPHIRSACARTKTTVTGATSARTILSRGNIHSYTFKSFVGGNPLKMTLRTRTGLFSNKSDSVSVSPSDAPPQTDLVNVLCLHGKGNNGKSFQNLLTPLEESLQKYAQKSNSSLQFQFDYLDAPFPMEGDVHEPHKKELQWWTLPPGTRSFNAIEYEGFDESSRLVEEALQSKNYHFIFGHSQGAILLSALITSDSWTQRVFHGTKNGNDEVNSQLKNYPLGLVFNGCAIPNPFLDQLESYQYDKSTKSTKTGEKSTSVDAYADTHKPQLFFMIGEKDQINPPDGAEFVRDALMKGGLVDAESCYHAGGHAVPVKDEASVQTLVDWMVHQASSGVCK